MELTGNLLIAPPAVKNNFWHKTVILVTEHHAHGSVGLVLNKRSQMSLVEFGSQIGININLPGFVYIGGPVNPKNLTVLHSKEWSSSNTMPINEHFSLSSSNDMIPRIANGDIPEYYRVFLGLSGWAPKQLISEIAGTPPWTHENSWLLTKADKTLVFGTDHNEQWCNALDQCGLEFAQSLLT
jgi:putative transcriptional regulator